MGVIEFKEYAYKRLAMSGLDLSNDDWKDYTRLTIRQRAILCIMVSLHTAEGDLIYSSFSKEVQTTMDYVIQHSNLAEYLGTTRQFMDPVYPELCEVVNSYVKDYEILEARRKASEKYLHLKG